MSQQLVKKGSDGRYSNVMPKSWIEAIKDKGTGQTLVEILQGFNMYFLPYNGNTSATRCSVPMILRKKGLWITYVKYDGNVYTEWYAASDIDDKSWGDSSNWRIGNNTLVGDITISANGNWVINGTESEFKAIGEKGNTPLIRVANNRLQVSYDLGDTYRNVAENPVYTQFRNYNNKIQVSTDLGATWTDASDEIAAYFRWQATTGDTQANNVGRLQISRDNKTWTNLSNNIVNNLHISKYIGSNEPLPTSGIAEGTIYAKGPTYAVEDTSNSNPIYRLWVYAWKGNTLAWQDNGEFTSIAAGIVQETGSNENAVMSQKAVTQSIRDYFNLTTNVEEIPMGADLNTYTKPGVYISKNSNYTESLINKPTTLSTHFKLVVIETTAMSGYKYIVQQTYSSNGQCFIRYMHGTSFNSWVQTTDKEYVDSVKESLNNRFKEVFDLSDVTPIRINKEDDLNDYVTPGTFISDISTVSITLKNTPKDVQHNFKLIVSTIGIFIDTKYIVQEIQDARNGRYYIRYCNSHGWGNWYEFTTSKYMEDYTVAVDEKLSKYYNLHKGINIPDNEDLNNYTTAGTYNCPTSIQVKTLINKPNDLTQNCKLIVDESIVGEVKQTIWSPREKTWVRYKNNNGWTEWNAIVLQKDINSILYSGIKFIDGYAYSNTCIIPVAAEGEDVEGTVIISFTTGDDVNSTQTVLNLGPTIDSTRIRLNAGNLELAVRTISPFRLISITPNTRYTVIFNNKGRVAINGAIYSNIVALKAVTGTVLGVRRTDTKSEPFKGIIHYLCGFDSNFTDLSNDEFKNLTQNIYSENYYTANKVIDNKLVNPNDSKSIAIIGQYTLEIKSENIKDSINSLEEEIKLNISDIENIKESLKYISEIAGSIRIAGNSSPDYTESIGDVTSIFKHFKLGLVKDGVLQYFVKQNNINYDEEEKFHSVLNGDDGDLLVVNDTPIYYLIYSTQNYDLKLFSLTPFTYLDTPCRILPVRGDAPSFGYIDNINSSNGNRSPRTVKEALGSGQIHYCRKEENVAHCDYPTMHYIKGRYIPSQDVDGNITYEWDSEAMYVTSGAYRPSVYVDLRSAEKAALNKNTNELLYTNKDILSREILIAMLNAEYKTKNVNNPQLFGAGWCNYASATDASQFENDVTLAKSGIRFKNNAGEWIYSTLSSTPFTKFTSSQFLYCLVSDWYSPWEIMEQHLAISYAVENNIPANTWYVYNNFEYKYRNVPGSVGLDDGVMTCVLFKKFRSKLNGETILKETGENLEGNDIEFVISSALYRGWVIDNAPQMWLTGINVVCTNQHVFTYVQHNYKKYLMDKNYGENEDVVRSYSKVLDAEGLWDFQKTYELASILPNNSSNMDARKVSSKCIMVPSTIGGGLSSYECCRFEPDKVGNRDDNTKCEDGEKIITGVKSGYGPFDGGAILNKLYMNHPRTDTAARTCYSSFVCQKVEINN